MIVNPSNAPIHLATAIEPCHGQETQSVAQMKWVVIVRDSQWKRLIDRAIKARQKADELTKLAEAEYERRYGTNPREVGVDDDWWIDTLDGLGDVSIEIIKSQAEYSTR